MSKAHKAVAITALGLFDEITLPTQTPGSGEVLVKHAYGSMLVSDTYQMDLGMGVDTFPLVMGFGAAGTVVEVGSDVLNLKVGDRVAVISLHSKALQEFSIQPWHLCAQIPDSLPLDQAAAIPDNFATSFYTIFHYLPLPLPDFPVVEPPPQADAPILVYGAGSIVGVYAVQILYAAGYRNIIATASPKHHEYLRSLGATHLFDYRSTSLTEDVAKVIGGDGKVLYAIDPIATKETIAAIAGLISPSGILAALLPFKEGTSVASVSSFFIKMPDEWNVLPEGAKYVEVSAMQFEKNSAYMKENLMPKILPKFMAHGLVKPAKLLLLDKGSLKERVGRGLDLLRTNQVAGEKIVVKIES